MSMVVLIRVHLRIASLILGTLFGNPGSSADTGLEQRLNETLSRFTAQDAPGVAVGVVLHGELVYAKGFGMANIEQGSPITPKSPFYIASASKQFTAACAALLVERGQLRLSDDVRTHLPELPDYGHKITVDHLIHHTSGVREWSSLILFRGEDPRYEQHISQDDVFRLLCRQNQLNSDPGSEYRYSSGGYVLLTAILERVSGRSLREFSREEIFEPLGMDQTRFEDNYAELLPGRVDSYRRTSNGQYERFLKHFDVYGDGGLVTTVGDMAKWDANFRSQRIGGNRFLKLMGSKGRLIDGREIPYAFGLESKSYRGRSTIEHNGGMLGYRADYIRFPDDDCSVIVLGNSSEAAGVVYQVIDQVLPIPHEKPMALPDATAKTDLVAVETEFLGHYWIASSNMYRRLTIADGRLLLDWGPQTDGDQLVAVSPDRFRVIRNGVPIGLVTLRKRGAEALLEYSSSSSVGDFRAVRYDPTPPEATKEVEQFVGEYYSEELDVTYELFLNGDALILKMGEAIPRQLFPPGESVVWNSKDMVFVKFGEIIFRRNSSGDVVGLAIGDSRVRGVNFVRTR